MIYCNKEQEFFKGVIGVPQLIVEVLSANEDYDLITKFCLYAEYGVREYWIVFPRGKKVEIYTLSKKNKYYEMQVFTFNEIIQSKRFEDIEVNLSKIELIEEY